MGRKTQIAIVVGVLVLLLGAVGAYAYDSSQEDKIADGVTIGGVDVGGMGEAEAEQAVRRQLLAPLRHSLRVGYDGEHWTLEGEDLRVHADLDRWQRVADPNQRELRDFAVCQDGRYTLAIAGLEDGNLELARWDGADRPEPLFVLPPTMSRALLCWQAPDSLVAPR